MTRVDALWRIELLGWLRLAGADRVITRFRTHKVASLLAFLAHPSHRSHPREELIELLWPETDPIAGRMSLRTALSSLRRQLEPPGIPPGAVLIADRTSVRLNPDVCVTDVALFEAALQAAARTVDLAQRKHRLTEAAELYRGDLLPGYFDEWVLAERRRLSEAHLKALGELTAGCEQEDDLYSAIQWARRAISADPLREETHQRLIRLLTAAGQPAAALRQYQDLERLLRQELGAAPEAALRTLARELEARVAAAHLTEGPPARTERLTLPGQPQGPAVVRPDPPESPASGSSAGTRAGVSRSLPPQFTRFFGREREIEQLEALLSCRDEPGTREAGGGMRNEAGSPLPHSSFLVPRPSRLVTLTGPGGTGKTRLAQEAAARVRERFEGMIAVVPLVSLAEPGLIAGQILDALRMPRAPGVPPFEQVVALLSAVPRFGTSRQFPGEGRTLLLLDNLEHLLPEGAAIVQALLEQVGTLSLWVASRQCLGLPGERELPVGPLPVPVVSGQWSVASEDRDPSDMATDHPPASRVHELATNASVALFVDRAQAVRADFQLTPANAPAVARLCAGLEGIPLAIELAAARIGVLTPAQMLARLEERFDLLTTHRRMPDRRHQSLRAALDWSYQLLSPEPQRFFARLSVFRGGWTLEAAEVVCGDFGFQILDFGLPAMSKASEDRTSLSDPIQNRKSKIQNTLDLLDQLRESSMVLAEEGPWGMRYRLLETLREYGRDRLQEAAETEVISERHARFFLDLVEQAEPELMGGQQAEWIGRLEEEYDNVRAALAWDQARQDEHVTGLRLVGALFWFWWVRCYLDEGAGWGRAVLARTGGALGVPALEERVAAPTRTSARAKACRCMGGMLWAQGKPDEARPLMEESVAIARELSDPGLLAHSLRFLGWVVLDQQDYRAAHSIGEESLALFRAIGDQSQIGRSLNYLASLARAQADDDLAAARWEETIAISGQAGDQWAVAIAHANLGKLAEHHGNPEAARWHFEQSLIMRRAIKDVRGIAECLEGLAAMGCGDTEMERAARLFGAAEAAHEAASAPPLMAMWPVEREPAMALVRSALGPATFSAAWAQGRAMPLEAAVAEALREVGG